MPEERVQRRLTVIFAADVAGYSRLMEADEETTLHTLNGHREITDRLIAHHDGRIFGTAGDSVMAEFGSAVEAVRCAIAIQEELKVRNAELVEERRMMFRIGINIGDVMVENGNLFGDGVNVAARLEGVAEPGGVCISGSAFDQVRNKLAIGFEDIGAQEVKNIAEPVRAYRVLPEGQHATAHVRRKTPSRWHIPAIVAAVLVLIAAGGIAWWQPWTPDVEPASIDKMAFKLPDKPSIAVLPFANMSGDKEQEYFADGITEDIITDLSQISGLLVISRNSSFAYKGQSPDIREVGRELGVGYIVEGSVRRAGGRLRITVQLVDASSAHHVWAERYDREEKDIFDLQDEVRGRVVAELKVKLTSDEEVRLARRLTASPEAYDLWLRGRRHESFFTKNANLESRRLFERAIQLDPNFAAAYASLGTAYFLASTLGWRENREEFIKKGLRMVEKAVALDGTLPQAHWALARATSRRTTFDGDRAVAALKKAISLDPNYADAFALLTNVKNNTGYAEEALSHMERAIRLNPRFPWWYFLELGKSQFLMTRYDAAAESFKKALQRNPNAIWPRQYLVATYGHMGNTDDADWELEELRAQGHEMSISRSRATVILLHPPYLEHYIEGLRKAGVKE